MIFSSSPLKQGLRTLGYGAVAAGIYLLMTQITLAHIESSTGLRPFDLRPMGYSSVEARGLLVALAEDGRAYYLTRQLVLDMFYPALMALTLVSLLGWFRAMSGAHWLVSCGIWLSVAAAIGDYLENVGIAGMLLIGPDVPEGLVLASSAASIFKAGATSLAMLFVLLSGARVLSHLRSRPTARV